MSQERDELSLFSFTSWLVTQQHPESSVLKSEFAAARAPSRCGSHEHIPEVATWASGHSGCSSSPSLAPPSRQGVSWNPQPKAALFASSSPSFIRFRWRRRGFADSGGQRHRAKKSLQLRHLKARPCDPLETKGFRAQTRRICASRKS